MHTKFKKVAIFFSIAFILTILITIIQIEITHAGVYLSINDHYLYLPLILNQAHSKPTITTTPKPTHTPIPTITSAPPIIQSPTYTSTPTNTPSPTPTRTPTDTEIPGEVKILSNHSYFVSSIDYLHIVGEVHNGTNNYLRYVKISVNIFNSSGQLLDTAYSYTTLDIISPGDKTCFEIIILDEPLGWSYYSFEQPDYWNDGEPLPNLYIFNDSGSYDSTYGWYSIIGQVRNNDDFRVEFVSPVGTLYNSTGTVLDCGFAYVNSTHLDPGQTSSFDMTFVSLDDYADVTLYRLQVDGNK